MSIDLHTHSTSSDGTMSPGELVQYAAKKGLSAIGITDHDTISGIEEALQTGETLGIEVVPGIELSVRYQNHNVHLLGYLFDYRQKELGAALAKLQAGRLERNRKIISRLNDLGCSLRYSDLEAGGPGGSNGRPHIARLLIEKKYVRSMDEAFSRYLGRHGQAYVSRFIYEVEEAISLLHNAGGVAVLAHPLQLENSIEELSIVLQQLSVMGLDGIEVYYPTHSKKFRNQLIAFADKYSLVMSGGSDYHGDIRPGTTLAGGKNVCVPSLLLDPLKERARMNAGRDDITNCN